MAKHSQRRERRERYHRMLDAEVASQKGSRSFMGRVVDTLNHGGLDIAPDGRPIKADFWRFIGSRAETDPSTARAGQFLVEKTVQSLQPSRPNV